MAFALFLPVDPWIVLLPDASSEVLIAIIVTVFGTIQWWFIGFLIGLGYHRIFKEKKKNTISL
jgi:hypothetical protein